MVLIGPAALSQSPTERLDQLIRDSDLAFSGDFRLASLKDLPADLIQGFHAFKHSRLA
jgi:hypothetical protein